MISRKAVGQTLWAHTRPGSTQITAIECMLCRDKVWERGGDPYVPAGLVKAVRLHFLLVHDTEATDIPHHL